MLVRFQKMWLLEGLWSRAWNKTISLLLLSV